MQYSEISQKVHSLKKGQFGVNVVASISCDKKFSSKFCPFIGRVQKVTLGTNIRLVSYEGKVEAKKNSDIPFAPTPLKGMRWIDYPYFKQSLKDDAVYLTIHYRPCDERTAFKSFYLLDGKVATAEQVREIEACMKSSKSFSKKQESVGITDEDCQVKVVQYVVDGVQYLGTDKATATEIWEGLKA